MPRPHDPTKCPYPGFEHLTISPTLSGQVLRNTWLKGRTDFTPGTLVYASDFSWEKPDTDTFPDGMTGVTFVKCHLHNLIIPPGNTLIDCSQIRFVVQNDGNDWLIDRNNLPVKPTNFRVFEKFRLPVPLPADIPVERVRDPIDLLAAARTEAARIAEAERIR